jgi:hypothetical protein
MLFHAQFAVRVVEWEAPLHLQSFAAGTRVAHTARCERNARVWHGRRSTRRRRR